jgi:hypothetical protein
MCPRALTRSASLLAATLLLAFAASACGKSPTSPTPTLVTETFTGTLAPKGTSSKPFAVSYALDYSDASVTVTSLTTTANATPITSTIGIGFGVIGFDGSCTRDAGYTADAASLNQELIASGVFINGAGINYCVQIYDVGTLTEAANYTFVVKHY